MTTPIEINPEWKEFGSFSGEEFLAMECKKREWLVENILREKDSVIIVGNEKSGKSVYAFQLICSLTSQHDFIDKYKVTKPCRVTYVQLEGEKGDSQDRMKRMVKALDINPAMFHYMFFPPLELHNKGWAQSFAQNIENFWKPEKPDVLIIDPVYFAFEGSLSDDELVRKFIGNLRIMKERLACSIILIHHTHKTKFSSDGFIIEEGDDVIFGSKFLKAWADHIILFMYDKRKEIRIMSCNTQRSGDIEKECILKMVEPDPLYFEEVKEEATKEMQIYSLLSIPKYSNGLSWSDICEILKLTKNNFFRSVKILIKNGAVCKIKNGRDTLYFINKENKNVGDISNTQQLVDNS